MRFDVAVIGGGVVGCAIARELSFTRARVVLLEAAHDLCEGASKGNTGIATSGADCAAGTLECDLVTRSSPRWEELCATLDTPFRRIGTLAVALEGEQLARLPELLEEAHAAGARAEIVSADRARELEPLITPDALGALHFPDDGIVDSIRLTIGYAELAARNGVEVRRSCPVTAIEMEGGRAVALRTPQGRIEADCVVNAAGVMADEISRMAEGDELRTWPRQGQYWLLDREIGGRFAKVVGGVPTPHTRGIYAVPTTPRSLLLGPTADDRENRGDRAVDAGTLEHVFASAAALVPSLRREHAIKTFAANRPAADRVYHVGRDERVGNVVHAAGIRSTGVSSSPALAELVRGLVAEIVPAAADEREDALRVLEPLPRLLDELEPGRLPLLDRRYGQVVCVCEQVTAAEIAAAYDMAVPPRSLEGLRKRTRAMGGRCQGALCMAGCSFMHSLHTGDRPTEIAVSEPEATLGV